MALGFWGMKLRDLSTEAVNCFFLYLLLITYYLLLITYYLLLITYYLLLITYYHYHIFCSSLSFLYTVFNQLILTSIVCSE
ncbi:hypothetical protein LYNGBM3L_11220 [Moorena producens 3L]|uniref:Uncharacterized protein n=1 Tax=Moorena producens 3L TaxID=489825 RepID=F4XKB9_9CYAN|nr:hypothetical protein LYNGBM3L_11220 [Moorena producens 3L]